MQLSFKFCSVLHLHATHGSFTAVAGLRLSNSPASCGHAAAAGVEAKQRVLGLDVSVRQSNKVSKFNNVCTYNNAAHPT